MNDIFIMLIAVGIGMLLGGIVDGIHRYSYWKNIRESMGMSKEEFNKLIKKGRKNKK